MNKANLPRTLLLLLPERPKERTRSSVLIKIRCVGNAGVCEQLLAEIGTVAVTGTEAGIERRTVTGTETESESGRGTVTGTVTGIGVEVEKESGIGRGAEVPVPLPGSGPGSVPGSLEFPRE